VCEGSTWKQRKLESIGPLGVPCMVSSRWLKFSEHSSVLEGGEFITVDVMTHSNGHHPRKLCELVITREDLERALNCVRAQVPGTP
jgi:hypothetical protein